ncbi:unnamed protein product [Didymodactylos carnosus]|uniref:Radical SAM core domain-containing protein n=1 Tax=Didymodactylos carnosus TaxID=1234261 RepID=A0A814GBU0_9BILA|nr:unnamed protein product [Didymodactylos carnosus]CAF3766201.1 unnamed protein product [Didymodactylos carnosus]
MYEKMELKDGINGLTFEHRNSKSLAQAMLHALQNPEKMEKLGERGYIYSSNGEVPCVNEHVDEMLKLYDELTNTQSYIPNKTVQEPKPLTSLSAPWRITFDTNPDDCNFSCVMCEQHSEHSPHQKARKEQKIRRRRMDFEVMKKVVTEAAPLGLKEIIPSTMGEPLMYRDLKGRTFEDIIQLCHDQKIKLNLTTNGSFFSPHGHSVEQWAQALVPVLSDIKFSWNSATKCTQELVMKNSKFEKQLSNLKTFISIRDKIAIVTLQLTFMEINLSEIPDIVKLGISLGVDRIKGHHLWAHFTQIKDQNLRRSPDSIRRWNKIVQECQTIAQNQLLPNGKQIKLENVFELSEDSGTSSIHPESTCPFLGKEAWINHSGRFDPCCAPDQERLSLGSFGNITDPNQQLMNIWNGATYKNLVKNYSSYPLCQNCNMRKPPTQQHS